MILNFEGIEMIEAYWYQNVESIWKHAKHPFVFSADKQPNISGWVNLDLLKQLLFCSIFRLQIPS